MLIITDVKSFVDKIYNAYIKYQQTKFVDSDEDWYAPKILAHFKALYLSYFLAYKGNKRYDINIYLFSNQAALN